MAELWDQELYISYNLTFNKSRRWAPRDRRAGSEGLKLKMTLKVFVEQLFSQLGGGVYRRLEAARPLRGARVEVFFPANEHHIVSGETWVHQSVMTRAIAVWWSEKRLDQKYVMSHSILMVVFKHVFNFFIHLPYQTIQDHTEVCHTQLPFFNPF